MKDVKVLIGNYGSGKSELALNFAMQAAARGDRTELLDLDMVNTYFRLTERGKMVEQKEIRLVSPNFACSGSMASGRCYPARLMPGRSRRTLRATPRGTQDG